MKLKLAALVVASAIGYPALSQALGLGSVKLHSALNEPLKADISVMSVARDEADGVKVSLAGTEEFARAGLERPYLLSKLRFKVFQEENGRTVIRVSTSVPIREPFLNFLLEVNWPRGRLLREYTLLLDPPVYGAAASMGVKGPVVSARTVEPPVQVAEVPAQPAAPAYNEIIGPSDMVPEPMPAAPVYGEIIGPSDGLPAYGGDVYGPITASDTLWSISQRVRPADISNQQMMLALLRANPEAFVDGNINRMRRGYVLQIPNAGEAASLTQAQAIREVRMQEEAWRDYVQTTSAGRPATSVPSQAARSVAPAVEDASRAVQAAASGAEDAARLKIVAPGTRSGAAGGSGVAAELESLRERMITGEEALDSARRENQELSEKLNIADDIIRDLRRAVELRDNELAALQRQMEEGAKSLPEPEMTATTRESVPPNKTQLAAPVKPGLKPKPTVEKPPAAVKKPPLRPSPVLPKPSKPKQESLMDTVKGMLPADPLIIGAGAGGLLALIAGGALFARRRKNKAEPAVGIATTASPEALDDDIPEPLFDGGEVTRDIRSADVPTEAKPQQKDSEVAASEDTVIEEPKDDPLAEVNVYLAYERYDQAEELVRKAISEHPSRHEYQLKLLEIHHAAKNAEGFASDARALRDSVGDDHEMMMRAREWWDELAPGRSLFEESKQATTEDLLYSSRSPRSLDELASGAAVAGAAAVGVAAAGDKDLDFDLGLTGEGVGEEASLDFDLELEGEGEDDALDLDLSAEVPSAGGGLDLDIGDGQMDEPFDLDMSGEQESAEVSTALDFDLGDLVDSGVDATEATLDHLADDAIELPETEDGALDFDLGEMTMDGEESIAGAGEELDLDLTATDPEAFSVMETLARSGKLDTNALDTSDEKSLVDGTKEPEIDLGMTMDDLKISALVEASIADDLELDESANSDDRHSETSVHLDLEMGLDESTLSGQDSNLDIGADDGGSVDTEPSSLDFDIGSSTADIAEALASQSGSIDLSLGLDEDAGSAGDEMPSIDFDLDIDGEEDHKTLALGREMDSDIDEIGTKLDLAQAYVDMGDSEGAKGILSEVMEEGDDSQKQEAQVLLDKIS